MWVCCIDRVEFGCVAFACIAIAASACVAAGRAALTMFRVSTGDDWVYIMQQCGVRPPVCTVSVSLTLATWHHTSPLGYILPAASDYDVQLCLVTHSCSYLQAPDNAANLFGILHSSEMGYVWLGQSQNVEHTLMMSPVFRVGVATLSCRRSSSAASLSSSP